MDWIKKFSKSYKNEIEELVLNLNLIVSLVKLIKWAIITFVGHRVQFSERDSLKKLTFAFKHRWVVSQWIETGSSGINTLCKQRLSLFAPIFGTSLWTFLSRNDTSKSHTFFTVAKMKNRLIQLFLCNDYSSQKIYALLSLRYTWMVFDLIVTFYLPHKYKMYLKE